MYLSTYSITYVYFVPLFYVLIDNNIKWMILMLGNFGVGNHLIQSCAKVVYQAEKGLLNSSEEILLYIFCKC